MAFARVLGAIVAGGVGRRFGSDKALAMLNGKPLIRHAAEALSAQVDELVVCGRDWGALTRLDDRPEPGMGPLGGIDAALWHGRQAGFDAVLVAPVDIWPLPGDLRVRLEAGDDDSGAPIVLQRQFVIGLWPTALADRVDAYLRGGGRAMRGILDLLHARRVDDPDGLCNINRREDLPAPHGKS